MNKRRQQAEQTKTNIELALEGLIKEKDFKDIQIREICQAAGISVGSFYVYFKSKEEALLYNYRNADLQFEEAAFDSTPLENIQRLFSIYYDLVDMDNPQLTAAIYHSHLTCHDEYFFSEERAVFIALNRELTKLAGRDCRSLTWEILEYARGRIYNFCINPINRENWRQRQIDKTMDYLNYLMSKETPGNG